MLRTAVVVAARRDPATAFSGTHRMIDTGAPPHILGRSDVDVNEVELEEAELPSGDGVKGDTGGKQCYNRWPALCYQGWPVMLPATRDGAACAQGVALPWEGSSAPVLP